MNVLHFLADEDFHFIGRVFGLQHKGVFLFNHTLEGCIVSVDGNNGNIAAIDIVLLADEQKISGFSEGVYLCRRHQGKSAPPLRFCE